MITLSPFRKLIVAAALIAAPAASFAGVFISVGFAPPALPVYAQPVCPGDGYIWTPGYWNYGTGGYFWVPGVWAQPPAAGLLWTPGYWGFVGGQYRFNEGYWGPHVGFYGGINYGFGYGGVGFEGGYWNGGHFFYNHAVANINVNLIHNVYQRPIAPVNPAFAHASFNGGQGGVFARPTPQQEAFAHENHVGPTANQMQHVQAAQANRSQYASANGGHPGTAAMQTNRDGFGHANEVNSRQGNQQSRINQGVRSGQMTPGETRNVENRDASINNQANADRAANGGRLTGQERQQINQRQDKVSRSINNDKHNANNDGAAAVRHGTTPGAEKQAAKGQERADKPHGH